MLQDKRYNEGQWAPSNLNTLDLRGVSEPNHFGEEFAPLTMPLPQ